MFRFEGLVAVFERKKRLDAGFFVHAGYIIMRFETCQLFLKYLIETKNGIVFRLLAAEKYEKKE